MAETQTAKDLIRQQMRERRHAVTESERKEAGRLICKNLMDQQIRLLLHAWRVCLYLSTKNEIPTRYIARAVWDAGREVCVPAWSVTDKTYKLSAITPTTKLAAGHHGIREPVVRIPILPWDVDAFVLPGLAFDLQGGRLGFGAGHYDGILAKATRHAPKIGLCYDWQLCEEPLPQDPHDIPMDWVVSEKRVVACAANRRAGTPAS